MFMPSPSPQSGQNTKTVTMARGKAASCINGFLLPLGFLLLSDNEAISGSVTASKTRPKAEINPRTVMKPPMTRPGIIYFVAPPTISPPVGK